MRAADTPTGTQFGRLVTSGRSRRRDGYIEWECSCLCGKRKWVNKGNLLNGYSKSCGCLQRERTSAASLINISGKKFGRLTVLERTERRRGCVYWLCRCECGQEKLVDGKHLRHGGTRSCGCLERESRGKVQRLKLAGCKFGRLTVSAEFEPRQGRLYWRCLCSCGREVWIPSGQLTSGNTRSCGCLMRDQMAKTAAARKKFAVVLTKDERARIESQMPRLLQQCFHYTNYQPLWASKNVRKSSRWEGKFWRHAEHKE